MFMQREKASPADLLGRILHTAFMSVGRTLLVNLDIKIEQRSCTSVISFEIVIRASTPKQNKTKQAGTLQQRRKHTIHSAEDLFSPH
jgi:hypothetical protein